MQRRCIEGYTCLAPLSHPGPASPIPRFVMPPNTRRAPHRAAQPFLLPLRRPAGRRQQQVTDELLGTCSPGTQTYNSGRRGCWTPIAGYWMREAEGSLLRKVNAMGRRGHRRDSA